MAHIYPGATWRPIAARYLPGTRITSHERVNLHVAASEAKSLRGFFNQPKRPSSHFYVRKDGTVEQYVDTDYRAEADLEGNATTISVETQGGVRNANAEPWTPEQVEALAQLFAWAVREHGIELRIADDSRPGASSRGLSWHRLGIDGNFPSSGILAGRRQRGGGMRYSSASGKICPGDAKIRQVPEIFARASEILGETPKKPEPVPNPVPKLSVPVLSLGSTGSAVEVLQREMNRVFPAYSRLKVDGSFGRSTDKVVREFQRRAGLEVDGYVGPATQAALARYGVRLSGSASGSKPAPKPKASSVLSRGSSGSAVRTLQRELNRVFPAYSRLAVDGHFGPATEKVVREFQRRAGLKVDGYVGPATQAALRRHGVKLK